MVTYRRARTRIIAPIRLTFLSVLVVLVLAACQTTGLTTLFGSPVEKAQSLVDSGKEFEAHNLILKNPNDFNPATAKKDPPEAVRAFMASFRPWVTDYLGRRAYSDKTALESSVNENDATIESLNEAISIAEERLKEVRKLQRVYRVNDGPDVEALVTAIEESRVSVADLYANEVLETPTADLVDFLRTHPEKDALVKGKAFSALARRLKELDSVNQILAISKVRTRDNAKKLWPLVAIASKRLEADLIGKGFPSSVAMPLVQAYVTAGGLTGPTGTKSVPVVFATWETESVVSPFKVEIACVSTCLRKTDALASKTALEDKIVIVFGRPFTATARNAISESKEASERRVGYKTVQNPAFISLRDHVLKLKESLDARRRSLDSSRNKTCETDLGCSLLNFAINTRVNSYNAAVDEYNSALKRLRNTPQTLQEAVIEPYEFTLTEIESSRGVLLPVTIVGLDGQAVFAPVIEIFPAIYEIASRVDANDTDKGRYAKTVEDLDEIESKDLVFSAMDILDSIMVSPISVHRAQPLIQFAKLDGKTFAGSYKEEGFGDMLAPSERPQGPYDNLMAGVVRIDTSTGLGSGFFLTPSLVLTNEHVVGDEGAVAVTLYSGETYAGQVVAVDAFRDIALISTNPVGRTIPLHNGPVSPGTELLVFGNPNGYSFSVSKGIVSAVRRRNLSDVPGAGTYKVVQTDAAISGGNSGGPMIVDGKVVALVAFSRVGSNTQNLNFGPHVDEIRTFLSNYRAGRTGM